MQSGPKVSIKFKASAKPRAQKTTVGNVGKRKATVAPEMCVAASVFNKNHLISHCLVYRPRKRIASGKQKPVQASDMDEAISQPGGFVDDDDCRSTTADRKEVINQKKISRRTATIRTSLIPSALSTHMLFLLIRLRSRSLTTLRSQR